MSFAVRGIALVLGNRRFWPFLVKPMLASAGIFLALIGLCYLLIVPKTQQIISGFGVSQQVADASATLGFLVLIWFLATILFIAVAGITSSFLWDRLSYEVERTVTPSPPKAATDFREWMLDTIPRTGFAAIIFCFSAGCFWLLPVCVALAAWLCLYDYTASAYLRRGVAFPAQFGRAPRNKGAITFALACGLLTLLPFVNLLLLPGLVAGGTLMVAENERS